MVNVAAAGVKASGNVGFLGDGGGVLDVVGGVIVRYVMPNGHWKSEELLLL